VWHASIALYGPEGGAPLETATVDRKRRRLAFAFAERLLDGVGAGKSLEQAKKVAFHLRRALSDDELRRIDQAWLAIPAVDAGDGPDEP
jgi:hypothetical protein